MNIAGIGITLDCIDVPRAASFWKEALGYEETAPYVAGTQFHSLTSPDGQMYFTLQLVAEPKTVKNRMHFDLLVTDLQAEVKRLTALGAHRANDPQEEVGAESVVLTDPLGNEFCLVQG